VNHSKGTLHVIGSITMSKRCNSDHGTIEAISVTSTTTDAAVREIVQKIVRIEQIQNAIAAEYVLSQEGSLTTYSVGSVEETCQVLNHALNIGAELLGLLGIDTTGNFFIATFGVAGAPNAQAGQDVLAFKDAFLERHAALLRDPFPATVLSKETE
jgi:hypothetical protein